MHSDKVGEVDFPTLGDVLDKWYKAHCRVPDGFARGKDFVQYDWQFWCTANHYRVREDAKWNPGRPLLNQAFVYRRSQVVGVQKTGKGPWMACVTAGEAVGPVIFGGWARGGERYYCSDHGCECGWDEYVYSAGDPMGIRHPSPLIQLTATSQDQVDNVYRPLVSMIHMGPLKHLLRPRENFIRIVGDSDDPDMDRIDAVTSSAMSRLGNPISFAPQDETGLWTPTNKMTKVADTQRRGLAGMGGRSIETTNPWDPSEQSVAQRTFESQTEDVFKFYRIPPANLSFRDKRERRKILRFNYEGSAHVVIDSIEAEAAELMETDPGQAERFFGGRAVAGQGTWCHREEWDARKAPQDVPAGTQVVVAFDGSDVDDWTGFRAMTKDGYQFTPAFPDGTPMIWNPADTGGQVPRLEVSAGLAHIMATYKVARGYFDPPYWETECDAWAAEYGETVIVRWYTRRVVQMHAAAERLLTDVRKKNSGFTHDACEITALHVSAARKSPRGTDGKYVLAKPGDGRKIDQAIPSILANEAHGDVTAAGWPVTENFAYFI